MRGMLWMDLKRMRWWILVFGIGIGMAMSFVYFGGYDNIWCGIVPQMLVMFCFRTIYTEDRTSGWMTTCSGIPHGRRKYITAKMLYLLIVWGFLLLCALAGYLVWLERFYQSLSTEFIEIWSNQGYPMEKPAYYLYYIFGAFGDMGEAVQFPKVPLTLLTMLVLFAVQIPVLVLCSHTVSMVWECLSNH